MRGRDGRRALVSDGSDANTRDCVVAIRALATAGYPVAVTVTEGSWKSGSSRYVDEKIVLPPAGNSGFDRDLSRLVETGRFAGVIPASEAVAQSLGAIGSDLMDKAVLERRAVEVGIAIVPSQRFDSVASLLKASSSIEYPVVVKPVVRSFKAVRIDEQSELERRIPEDVPLLAQPYVVGQVQVVSGVMWHGTVHSAVQERWERIWPRDCGLGAAATSVEVDEEIVARLGRLMSSYEGLFSAQFIEGRLIDLNLRAHSSMPLAVAAGVNPPSIYLDLLRGEEPDPKRGRPGCRYRWISGELKGVARDLRAGSMSLAEARAILRPRSRTVHSMFSLRDPVPFLLRLGDYV